MLVGFSRISHHSQDHSHQIDALERVGCERIFVETCSGTKDERPQLEEALAFLRPGDCLVVHSLSRASRSIRKLLDLIETLNAREIGFRSLTENIDTSTPQGRLWVHFAAALQQFEVEQLRSRTRSGLEAARRRGRVGGRPRSLDDTKLKVARALIANGQMTMAEVAQHVGCAPSTLYRTLPGGRSARVPSEAA